MNEGDVLTICAVCGATLAVNGKEVQTFQVLEECRHSPTVTAVVTAQNRVQIQTGSAE